MNLIAENQNPTTSTAPVVNSPEILQVPVKPEDPIDPTKVPMRTGGGINLVPLPSVQEVKLEEKKGKFNIGGALAILALVLFSLGIVGYNAFARITLSNKNTELKKIEKDVRSYSYTLKSNNEILDRFVLYQNVEDKTFSPKEVLIFWQDVSKDLGTIEGIELSEGLKFVIRGKAENLTDVAKLWHFLSIDQRISRVNLDSMAVAKDGVQFSFEGDLNFDYFSSK